MNIFSIFSQAWQGVNLTPAQRAFLKVFQGLVITAVTAGLLAGAQYVATNGTINWHNLLYLVLGAIVVTLGSGLSKYFTAQGDAPLAMVTDNATSAIMTGLENDLTGPGTIPPSPPAGGSVLAPAMQYIPVQPMYTTYPSPLQGSSTQGTAIPEDTMPRSQAMPKSA